MKIVVTGATGFIGSNLVPALTDCGHEIFAVTRRPADGDSAATAVPGDLSDPGWKPESVLPSRVDAIVHLAQSLEYRSFPENADDVFNVNTSATFRLLEFGRQAGASHFVYASSGSVYTGLEENPLSERAAVIPSNFSTPPMGFYCASKFCGETLLEAYRSFYRSVTSARIFAPYGPGGSSSVINRVAERVAAGETVEIQGNPGLKLNPIHVEDLVSIFRRLLENEESMGALNVAGEEVISLTDLVEIAAGITGKPVAIEYRSSEPPEGVALIADINRLKGKLAFETTVNIEEGLRSILAG